MALCFKLWIKCSLHMFYRQLAPLVWMQCTWTYQSCSKACVLWMSKSFRVLVCFVCEIQPPLVRGHEICMETCSTAWTMHIVQAVYLIPVATSSNCAHISTYPSWLFIWYCLKGTRGSRRDWEEVRVGKEARSNVPVGSGGCWEHIWKENKVS